MPRLSFLIATGLFVVSFAASGAGHPGGTDDEGCHVCRSDCEKWDEQAGERHCHGGGDSSEEGDESSSDGDDGGDDEEEVALSEDVRVYVDKVLDGDTLVVRPVVEREGERIRIRILGIDCPESHKNPKCMRQGRQGGPDCEEQIPRGKKAGRHVAELIKHETVRLESGEDDEKFDRGGYDRILAYVRLDDGRDLGKHLVEKGLCRDYGHKYPHPRHDDYQEASR